MKAARERRSFARAFVALAALSACSPIEIDRHADHMATLLLTEVTAPGTSSGGHKFALLRSAGDELTVIALTPQADFSDLAPLLAERGLVRVSALVLAITPDALPRLPPGVEVRSTYAPAGAPCPSAIVVEAPVELRLTGLDVTLSPCGAEGARRGLAVEIRHAGNRMLLIPEVNGAASEIAKRVQAGPIDLLGVVSSGTLQSLRDAGGLDRAQVVVADAKRGAGRFDVVSLADTRRVLFQSEEGHRPVRIDVAGRTP